MCVGFFALTQQQVLVRRLELHLECIYFPCPGSLQVIRNLKHLKKEMNISWGLHSCQCLILARIVILDSSVTSEVIGCFYLYQIGLLAALAKLLLQNLTAVAKSSLVSFLLVCLQT